jgi:DNA-3-methyladenine glycosylase
MFGPAGFAYVYFIYGNHHCLNVVTGVDGEAAAVLIRAIEPLQGVEIMQMLRGQATGRNLTNGPGKLCQALGIDQALSGHDLTISSELWLEPGPPLLDRICVSPRVGVRGDERALTAPWRFFLCDNAYVSPGPLNKLATLHPFRRP